MAQASLHIHLWYLAFAFVLGSHSVIFGLLYSKEKSKPHDGSQLRSTRFILLSLAFLFWTIYWAASAFEIRSLLLIYLRILGYVLAFISIALIAHNYLAYRRKRCARS